jgi:hypothetical protein
VYAKSESEGDRVARQILRNKANLVRDMDSAKRTQFARDPRAHASPSDFFSREGDLERLKDRPIPQTIF